MDLPMTEKSAPVDHEHFAKSTRTVSDAPEIEARRWAFDGVGEGGQMDFPVYEGWTRDASSVGRWDLRQGQPLGCPRWAER